MPKGIHTRGTPIGVHTVDFLIWIPDRLMRRDSEIAPTKKRPSRFGDRSYSL